ncbi:exonuclease GOR-like isoform X1 [Galleria mellonella]|uniref:Exonuclease GOR-like isoform X1 n=1 Tax=Galleria mellonella TaxID=7137 RepID=A0A6J1X6K7_GALME|nr:exonuclease GOR-like isoform X1 [Galleria mellonella]
MGDIQAGLNTNVFLVAGITVFLCILIHFVYKTFFGSKKKEIFKDEAENNLGAPAEEVVSETKSPQNRVSGKSKKRAPWKGKTEFSHPWHLKNLKGHPGTVLMADFSANGKFMAATCDETVTTVDSTSIAARLHKPRDRRLSPSAPPTPSTPQRISSKELAEALRPHLLSPERMWALGYPLEIEPNSSKAVVYINPPLRSRPLPHTTWDVNAPEFVPSGSQGDSGRGSWGSTPRSDSDEEADTVDIHLCVRCDKMFQITREGEYLKKESCVYHWGRLSGDRYACCNAVFGTRGCTVACFHVWSGTRPGMNGPLEGYVRARSPRGGVYALDAEMCYTTAGLELASIAVIAPDGRLVYKSLVKPSSPVVDHNTRFSGIRPRDLGRATKTLRDVQNDILGFVGTDTILIGHALDNDLRALKLLHSAVVDTCALYPHAKGFPLRRSLRALSKELLGRNVQRNTAGHSPLEDARAAMDLVLLKVHEERANRARKSNQSHVLQPYDPLVSAA